MKLFEHKARILSVQTSSKGLTSSEGLSKCICNRFNMYDHYSCILPDLNQNCIKKAIEASKCIFFFLHFDLSIQNGVILQTFKGKNIVSTSLPHTKFIRTKTSAK